MIRFRFALRPVDQIQPDTGLVLADGHERFWEDLLDLLRRTPKAS